MTTLWIHPSAFLIGAEISASALAPFARPTGGLNPGGAHAIAYFSGGNVRGHGHNLADRFVAQNSGKLAGNVSQSFVYIGITDAACVHFHQDLVGAGLRLGNVLNLPGTAFSGYDSSLHICFLHSDSMRQFCKFTHRFLRSRFFCSCLGEAPRSPSGISILTSRPTDNLYVSA